MSKLVLIFLTCLVLISVFLSTCKIIYFPMTFFFKYSLSYIEVEFSFLVFICRLVI